MYSLPIYDAALFLRRMEWPASECGHFETIEPDQSVMGIVQAVGVNAAREADGHADSTQSTGIMRASTIELI
jgi:hypothetical protein